MAILILGAIGAIAYVVQFHPPEAKFTEFYILGLEGKAKDYPEVLRVGQEGRVLLSIVNYEYKTVSYWVEVRIDGVRNNKIGPIILGHGKKWQNEMSFTPKVAGLEQKVEFLLYQEEGSQQHSSSLHIWIDVKPEEEENK